MPNFNEMIELNIGLLVFAILVTFFILLGCVGYKSRNLSYMRNFVWIVCMNLVMLIGECGLWIMKLGFKNVWLTKLEVCVPVSIERLSNYYEGNIISKKKATLFEKALATV